MHLQRIGIILGSIVGIISAFFPWIRLAVFSKTPEKISWGVIGAFVLMILLSLGGDKKVALGTVSRWIIRVLGIGVIGLALFLWGTVRGVISTAGVHKQLLLKTVTEREGIYILILGAAIAFLSALYPKKKKVADDVEGEREK